MRIIISKKLCSLLLALTWFTVFPAHAVPVLGTIDVTGAVQSNEFGSLTDCYQSAGFGVLTATGCNNFGGSGVSATFEQSLAFNGAGTIGWIFANQSGAALTGVSFIGSLDAQLVDSDTFALLGLSFGNVLPFAIPDIPDGFQFTAVLTFTEGPNGIFTNGSPGCFGPCPTDFLFGGTAPVGSITPIDTTPVPEPSSLVLLGLGLLGLGVARRRNQSVHKG